MTSETALQRLQARQKEEEFCMFGNLELVNQKNSSLTQKSAKANGNDEADMGLVFFKGYANTIEVDRINDKILPKAWEKSIQKDSDYMNNPILGYNHYGVIGQVEELSADNYGLYVEDAHINPKLNDTAKDVAYAVENGYLRTMSIMGKPTEVEEVRDEKSGEWIYIIKDFELVEISIVDIPMNPKSLLELKSTGKLDKEALRDMQRFVRKMKQNYKKRSTQMAEESEVEEKEKSDEEIEISMTEEEINEEEELEKTLTSDDVIKGINTIASNIESLNAGMDNLEQRISKLENDDSHSRKSGRSKIKRTLKISSAKIQEAAKEGAREALKELFAEDGLDVKNIKTKSLDQSSKTTQDSEPKMKTQHETPSSNKDIGGLFSEEPIRGQGALAKTLERIKQNQNGAKR